MQGEAAYQVVEVSERVHAVRPQCNQNVIDGVLHQPASPEHQLEVFERDRKQPFSVLLVLLFRLPGRAEAKVPCGQQGATPTSLTPKARCCSPPLPSG